ncbi:GerAB/ArcD/ProY family transporter [Chryseomicrobium sp. FSL W7-1435]|uniref:GerAB/ArcD/ProY family transporter n=1 Tax=Chryseomicrobium sp. FSL W7-1435 TaxID=2921704 RepID=UPI00315AC7FF
MNKTNEAVWSVTKLQIFMFLFVLQSGTTFINLQFRVINASNQHAWWLFIGVCILHGLIYLMYIKGRRFFHPTRFEKLLFQFYWTFLVFVFLTKIVFIAQLWVFQETPTWVILLCISVVFIYALTAHASVVLNLPVLLAPFFTLLIGTLFLSWSELVWLNIFPLGGIDMKEAAAGTFQSLSAFTGMEALLFLQPNLERKVKIVLKDIVIFMSVFTSFLTLSILFTLLFFSLEEIKVVPFALMYLLKSQEVTFIERIDLIFIYLWISWSIVSVILYGFLIFRTGTTTIPTTKKLVFPVLLVCIVTSFFISRFEIRILHDGMLYTSLIFSLVLPFIIMLRGRWRSRET